MSLSLHDRASIPGSPDLSRPSPLGHPRTSSVQPSGSQQSQCSPSRVELAPHTDALDTPYSLNETLISPSHGSRLARPSTLLPGFCSHPKITPHSAISDQYLSYTRDQNVFPQDLLNYRPISHRSGLSPIPGFQVSSPPVLESPRLSSSSSRHGAINSHSARPPTSNQVFNNISDLASHYGIPQFLPVAPRTTPRRTADFQEASSSQQTESFLSSPDFQNLCSNYLTMLSQSPGDDGATDVPEEGTAPAASPNVTEAELKSIMDVLNATPELQMSNDLNEYLTSPLIDSPLDDDLLTTPAVGSDMHADILTSPMLVDFGGNDSFDEFPPLFDGFGEAFIQGSKPPPNEPPIPKPDFDDMYRITTPLTPLIDTPSTSPLDREIASLPKRISNATGTRKNITPESLVPIDAPTQTRKYLTPSATSRKALPATWRRKRQRTAGPGMEEDELAEEGTTPSQTEQAQIEAKRRQNTVAARRSRKRKLEYQRELEESVEEYKRQSEIWRQLAMTYEALLRSHHIDCPGFPES